MTKNGFQELVGEDLSGVTFIRDYVQLQFNPPLVLNVYTPITVRTVSGTAISGEEAFANLLIGQINRSVSRVEYRERHELEIAFSDGSSILVSLRVEHYIGPEAVNLLQRWRTHR